MKKLFTLFAIVMIIAFSSCDKFDDSEIWGVLNKYGDRISVLEELCKTMNTNITNLQTIVKALQNNDYITSVAPIRKDGEIIGYTISFAKSDTITIYNGEDGKDGYTPQISIRVSDDNIYYWTIDGEWILDNAGNKIKAVGIDGITPKFKIEGEYWYVSYDGEKTWSQLGKAKDKNGLYNTDGEMVFKGVEIEDDYVVFTLNDGKNTQIKVPFSNGEFLTVHIDSAGTLKSLLTSEQQRKVVSLKITGDYNENDLRFINALLPSLEELDLADAYMKGSFKLNPFGEIAVNRTIRHLILGDTKPGHEGDVIKPSHFNIFYFYALTKVTLTADLIMIERGSSTGENNVIGKCPMLSKIIIAEGVTELGRDYPYALCNTLVLPSTLKYVGYNSFGSGAETKHMKKLICYSIIPPIVNNPPYTYEVFYDAYNTIKNCTLYVPAESVELYKSTNCWKQFGTILPLEDYKE